MSGRLIISTLVLVLLPLTAVAQVSALASFNPSQSGGLCGLGIDPVTGNVWVYSCSGATIDGYTPAGAFIAAIARPGEAANDVDIEFAPEELNLGGTVVPRGTLLFINGETGVAEIYGIDTGSGAVLASLVTAFGSSHVVGGGYDPVRDVFFLVQDRVPSGGIDNRVAEVDPVTGAVVNSFPVSAHFDVNYGDLDVSAGTGRLFLVSSFETGMAEFTPGGVFVAEHALPVGVADLSGVGLVCEAQEAWVASTAGVVTRLGGVPCAAASPAPDLADHRFSLQPNFPDPFTSATEFRFSLPRAASVLVTVHDVRGRRVRTLVQESLPAGDHAAHWDGRDDAGRPLPSGAYFCHLAAGGATVSQKSVLLR